MNCAPDEGTIKGNDDGELIPAGRVPSVTAGVEVVAVAVAYTVTEIVVPGYVEKLATATERLRLGFEIGVEEELPLPPPHPLKESAIKTPGNKRAI